MIFGTTESELLIVVGVIRPPSSMPVLIIGDAIFQSYRGSRYIENTIDCTCKLPEESNVQPINRNNLIRISVSFSYAVTIIFSISLLQDFIIVDENEAFGWTVNIHDLFVFNDLIDLEEQFLNLFIQATAII